MADGQIADGVVNGVSDATRRAFSGGTPIANARAAMAAALASMQR